MDVDESELAKLQRQFRIMEGDRQAYSLEAKEQIRRQQQEKDKLLKEQEELLRNLGISGSLSRQQQDIEETEGLQTLLEQRDLLEQELDQERQSHQELRRQITNLEERLAQSRRLEVTGQDTKRTEAQRTKKAIQTLEYKLDQALTRFNQQLTKNTLLREELQTLHIERSRFQQLRERLEKELQEVNKKIGEVVNLSTSAYDASMEAQSKMSLMKEKALKELLQYNAEMKELERVIAHENNLKEFMSTKSSERSGQDDRQETGRRRESGLQAQQRTRAGEETLESLEEVLHTIKEVIGEEDRDLLVTRFIHAEDRNLALFNFVNEQNTEVEALRDQINQMEAEMEGFQQKGLQHEQDYRSLLRDTEKQLQETESRAELHEHEVEVTGQILKEIKTGVTRTFTALQCDRSVDEDLLGLSTSISDNNIMFYLGLVEQKTNELLTIQDFIRSKDLEKDYNPRDLATILLAQNLEELQIDVRMQPTVHSVDYDLEEERPLTQGELRRRIMKEELGYDQQTVTKIEDGRLSLEKLLN